uniref:Uncharacterized protein n=1 Tax=Oryza nivara TaxID=4536 RepID=A0A0E0GBB8_ORYNI
MKMKMKMMVMMPLSLLGDFSSDKYLPGRAQAQKKIMHAKWQTVNHMRAPMSTLYDQRIIKGQSIFPIVFEENPSHK